MEGSTLPDASARTEVQMAKGKRNPKEKNKTGPLEKRKKGNTNPEDPGAESPTLKKRHRHYVIFSYFRNEKWDYGTRQKGRGKKGGNQGACDEI